VLQRACDSEAEEEDDEEEEEEDGAGAVAAEEMEDIYLKTHDDVTTCSRGFENEAVDAAVMLMLHQPLLLAFR
jgi:hypothetical protein